MKRQVDNCIHGRSIDAICQACERETQYGCGRIIEVSEADIQNAMQAVFNMTTPHALPYIVAGWAVKPEDRVWGEDRIRITYRVGGALQ